MLRSFRKGLLSLLLLILLLPACRKRDAGTDTSVAKEAHRLFTFHTGLIPLLERIHYSKKGAGPQKGGSFCGELELVKGDTAGFPDQNSLTYRYGPKGACKGVEGEYIGGHLRVTFHGIMTEEGSKVVLQGEGLSSGKVAMKGRSVIEREKDAWSFRWNGTEFRLDGELVTMIGKMEVVRTLGAASEGSVDDDRYRYEPAIKGQGIGGSSYQIQHRGVIERDIGCRWPWEGTLWVKPRDIGVRELDYGTGESCDDTAQVRVNGKALRMPLDQSLLGS